jgi:CRP-like cAMP-binding protein
MENLRSLLALCALSFLLSACETTPDPPDPQQQLVERGRDIFFDETFDGNGRTCGTCHREDNNFTIVVKKRGQELTTLKAGDCFGEMGYLARNRRTATISALNDVRILRINETQMEQAQDSVQARFNKVFLKTLVQRLEKTSDELTNQSGG